MTFIIRKGFVIGLISGIILAAAMKIAELLTGQLIYVLLMNVDFIPIIGSILWPWWIELSFHLIISLLIAIVYVWILQLRTFSFRTQVWIAVALALPTLFLFFPLSILAIKEVPEPTDWTALFLWIICHAIYTFSLPILNRFIISKRS